MSTPIWAERSPCQCPLIHFTDPSLCFSVYKIGRSETAGCQVRALTQGLDSSLETLMLWVLHTHDQLHIHTPAVGIQMYDQIPHTHTHTPLTSTQASATQPSLLSVYFGRWGPKEIFQIPPNQMKRSLTKHSGGQVLRGSDGRSQEQKSPNHTKAHRSSEWL